MSAGRPRRRRSGDAAPVEPPGLIAAATEHVERVFIAPRTPVHVTLPNGEVHEGLYANHESGIWARLRDGQDTLVFVPDSRWWVSPVEEVATHSFPVEMVGELTEAEEAAIDEAAAAVAEEIDESIVEAFALPTRVEEVSGRIVPVLPDETLYEEDE